MLSRITELYPHPEVSEALEKLKKSGFKLIALTNGGKDTVGKQLKNAKLENYFDAVYSVEAVGKFKPHPDTYHYVLEKEQVRPENSLLIAAHAWDITGAQRAGLKTAFINRRGKFLYPLAQPHEIIGEDLNKIIPFLKA